MPIIKPEELSKLKHLNPKAVGERHVVMCPVWNGLEWTLWMPTQDGLLIKAKMQDAAHCTYLTKGALADENDLLFSFLNFSHQKLSFPEIRGLVHAIEDDFHLLAVHAAKLSFFFEQRDTVAATLLSSFVRSELEGMLVTSRSVFDLTHEVFSKIWNDRVALLNKQDDAKKRQNRLPRKLTKFVLQDDKIRAAVDITNTYALPDKIAETYNKHASSLQRIRGARDLIVHGTRSTEHIYITERGFAVNPNSAPFDEIEWQDYHRYNENLVSLKPWVAHLVLGTIEACSEILESLLLAVDFGPDMFPEYQVRLRDPANYAIVDLLNAASENIKVAEASAFWNDTS